ncbi:mannonate dehydratase [Saccharopolyspora sp. NPDC002376]
MKIGLGLYQHMLTSENLKFARQAGATHIVAHLVDYFSAGPRIPASVSRESGWGPTRRVGKPWTLDEIEGVKSLVEAEGLTLHAIENLDPGHWHDVLLGGPYRDEQLDQVLESIRLLGQAGIPCLGYNFSLAGVWGHVTGPFARGGAESIGFDAEKVREQPEIPRGQVWNMTYDDSCGDETIGAVDADTMWARLLAFLDSAVPVAEAAGVRLCAHPEDPPMPRLRNIARVLTSQDALQRLVDHRPSRSNSLEFCQGTVSEMPDVDVYDAIATFSRQDRIGYVHFRNVVGKLPRYREVFIDEGDVDMFRALRTYAENGYDGVFIPDHTPQLSCAAPWHAGMAYALGYLRAAMRAVDAI